MKERYAISGSHGFIGERLVTKLEQQDQLVDRLGRGGFIPPEAQIIFDLASYGNLAHQAEKVKEIYKANFIRVLDELPQLRPEQRFIYVSSSSVMLPVQTFYSSSKKAAEELIQRWVEKYDTPACIVRPFTIIGPGEHQEHLIPKLINSCLTDEEMPFVAEPVHDFLHVDDFIEALILIARNVPEHKGEVFEVGSGQQHTNQEVKEIIEKLLNKKANIKPVAQMRTYDTAKWVANTTKIKALGWKPEKNLEWAIWDMCKEALEII